MILSSDCGWAKHAEYARNKCMSNKGRLARLLKNKRVHTDVKRIMLLAVIRPRAEYAATVWHANAPQQSALESVQQQILSGLAGCPNTTSAHILRLEMGCRKFQSWADQRKLEYFYKLHNMPSARLPRQVWQHGWQEGRRRGGQLKMWSKVIDEVATSVGMPDLAGACDAAASYSSFKRQASMAVRVRDMALVRRDAEAQTTLARYLPMLGPAVAAVPNTLQAYLQGVGPCLHSRLKMQFRSGTAAVAHRKELTTRSSRRVDTESSQCPCCTHTDETCQHVVLECPHYTHRREQLKHELAGVVGSERVTVWEELADEQQYQTLLSDHFWGGNEETTAVDSIVKAYLADIWDARQLVIRGQTADAGAGPHGLMATGTAP